MESSSVFLLGALMMLANGGVLGLMHGDLPHTLRPSAVSWRIATLLQAGGCMLFMVQHALPPGFVLPLANAMVLVGGTGYWRALRQFYGVPDSWWLLLPATVATAGVYWFVAVAPNIVSEALIVTTAWIVLMLGCMRNLVGQRRRDRAISRRVMIGIFAFVILFVLGRLAAILAIGPAAARPAAGAGAGWLVHLVTTLVQCALPVIGTTVFLLMMSERIRRQWERAASTDYLTGLPNRRTLAEEGARRFAAARARREGFAVALIDIDHFKAINDRHGHDIGDVALRHLALQLQAACREDELPARQGGEEFVVLFLGVDAASAHAAGERLRLAVAEQPFVAGGLLLPLTVSIGVAVQGPEDADFEGLLRRADAALYAAKDGGRNRVAAAPERKIA